MSFGQGNLQERVDELERENARLLASLLAATESAHADWPALALDWDDAGEARKREWCQWLYEHAARQDGRIVALEARSDELERANGILQASLDRTREKAMRRGAVVAEKQERIEALESLVRDMFVCCEAGKCDECSRESFCGGTVDFADRMAELGIETEAGES